MPLSTYSVLAYVLFLIGHINLVVRLQQSVESLSNKSIESTIDCIDAPYAKALPSPGAAMTLYVCCISTVFEPIELFDSEGHRVMSKSDHIVQNAHSKTVQQCSCSAWVVLPAHTFQILGSADISDGYQLRPGRYTISERNPPSAV
jgi:hypothetical protein